LALDSFASPLHSTILALSVIITIFNDTHGIIEAPRRKYGREDVCLHVQFTGWVESLKSNDINVLGSLTLNPTYKKRVFVNIYLGVIVVANLNKIL
jgi:hypothetical protein